MKMNEEATFAVYQKKLKGSATAATINYIVIGGYMK